MRLKYMAIYNCITNLFHKKNFSLAVWYPSCLVTWHPQVCWSPVLLATESGNRWTLLSLLPEAQSVLGRLRVGSSLCLAPSCTALLSRPPGFGAHVLFEGAFQLFGFQQNKRLGGSSCQLISQTQVRAISAHVSWVLVCHGGSGDSWWWHCICSPHDTEKYSSFILLTLVFPVCLGSRPTD